MADVGKMDRNLALEAVRVTEAAALAASKLMGRGDEKAADQAAVDAMRSALNTLSIDGTVLWIRQRILGFGLTRNDSARSYHCPTARDDRATCGKTLEHVERGRDIRGDRYSGE